MKLHYAIILSGSLALVGLTASTLAQKPKGPSIGKVKGGSPSGPSIGKSAVEGTGTKAEQGRVIDIPRVKVVQVAPNKGYLALFTRPHARVVITPLSGENEPGKPLSPGIADTEGLVVFPGLAPGNYKLEITCQDYEPLDDTVNIEKGKQTARLAPLASKFATLRIGLAGQADKDVLVKLNNEPFEKTKIEAGQLVFERVPVGKQTFTFSKAGYQDWTQEFEIRPGNNFFSAAMKEAVVAVTIQTQPHAEVYIDSDAKREASETGELQLNLLPGTRNVRVTLPGYEPAGKVLNLTLEPRALTVPIALTPIAEDSAFDEPFNPQVKTWTPFPLPAGWQLQTARPRGMRLTGELPAFVFNTSLPNRRFNIYKDFDMLMNVRLTNGRGVAWIVRAQDEKNYYLFELDNEKKELLFCIYQNGQRRQIKVASTVIGLDDKQRSYRIILEVRGNQFTHKIVIDDPNDPKPLGIVFEDSTFAYGGVGLRTFTNAEVFIDQFSILKPQNSAQRTAR